MASVLLVDDSELVLDMLEMALSEHSITRAGTAKEALKAVSRETFDAVVTDLNLPDRDGGALLAELKEHGVMAPIYLMSGMPDAELRARAEELGAAGAISKDLGLPGMAAQLDELLG
jgi:DNA-binding NtrC family response regulator